MWSSDNRPVFSLFVFNVPSIFITRVFIGDGLPSVFLNLHCNTPQRLDSQDISRTNPYFYSPWWVTVRLALSPMGPHADVIAFKRALRRSRRSHAGGTAPQLLVLRLFEVFATLPKPSSRVLLSPVERRRRSAFAVTAKAWSPMASAPLLSLAHRIHKPSVDGRR